MVDVVKEFIGSYGFPISVCVYLLYDNYRIRKEHTEERLSHKEERKEILEIVKNNTLVCTEIKTILERSTLND